MSKRTFDFGKVDWNGCGRRFNRMTVNVELKENSNGNPTLAICSRPTFSVVGEIWNSKETDIIAGGQCLDEMYRFHKCNPVFKQIYRLWKAYHLNDMHAGTEKQEACIEEAKKNGTFDAIQKEMHADHYDTCRELLKRNNLYEDNGYRYGSAWLYRAIPANDLAIINQLLDKNNTMDDLKEAFRV